jgi:hypothetical protein
MVNAKNNHRMQAKNHTVPLTIETTKIIAMKRLAIPTTLVPALIPNAMDTALMFVMTTNRKYMKNLDALSWNPVNTK